MVLSPSARNRWIAYHDHIEVDLSGGLQAVRGLANKIPEIAARLAGVLALVEDIGAGEITDESLERSVALTDHYLAEALRLFQGSQVSAELLRAQELLRWLTAMWAHRPYVGLRHIYQYGPNALRDKFTAKRLVEILVEHQQLVRIEGGRTSAAPSVGKRGGLWGSADERVSQVFRSPNCSDWHP